MRLSRSLPALLAALALYGGPSFADGVNAEIERLDKRLDAQEARIKELQTRQASPAPAPEQETTIGGYGEMIYQNYGNNRPRNNADLLRVVLFVGHRFNDNVSFFSEIEWEHAVAAAADMGESEIEQAYLDFRVGEGTVIRAGLFLMPFGFINESHEPPQFYGVERNFVERYIIPTTWREGGVSLRVGTLSGLEWSAGLTTGFNVTKFTSPADSHWPLQGMHQEMELAQASDLSLYSALNYRGMPGITLGGAIFNGNTTQGNQTYILDNTQPNFANVNGQLTLWETHARWQPGPWDFEALYADGRFGDADTIDHILQTYNAGKAAPYPFVPTEFNGWFAQAAYTFRISSEASISPFARYEEYNTVVGMPAGISQIYSPQNLPSDLYDRVTTVGFSFKPVQQVVIKADYRWFQVNPADNRLNLGLGYMF